MSRVKRGVTSHAKHKKVYKLAKGFRGRRPLATVRFKLQGAKIMARVKRGVTAHARHKKVLKAAKGYYGRRKNTIRVAKQAVEKANQYAFRDRKRRKRTFRALWIQRLNAAVRPFGLNYSRFIDGLAKAAIMVDRKVLSDLAITEPAAFQAIVEQAKAALPAAA